MAEETNNNVPDLTADTINNKPTEISAQDRLVNALTSESPVGQPKKIDDSVPSPGEEQFINYVAKKSQEIPDIPENKETEPVEKEGVLKKEIQEEKKTKHGDVIRTYYTDVDETIRNQKISLADMAIAADKKRSMHVAPTVEEEPEPKKASFKRVGLNILSVVLVLVGVGVLSFLYMQHQERASVDPTIPENTLALANSNVTLEVTEATRESLLMALSDITKTANGKPDDVINVSLVTGLEAKKISSTDFFNKLDAVSDPAFLRSIQDPYMLGVHISDTPHYFLILKTSFFDNAFTGMLRWEGTIAKELPFLLREIEKEPEIAVPVATSTSTTTPVEQSPPEEIILDESPVPVPFEDVVLHNKDVRARKGNDGNFDMLYTFTDSETLIITTNTDTLGAILNRLTVARFKQ